MSYTDDEKDAISLKKFYESGLSFVCDGKSVAVKPSQSTVNLINKNLPSDFEPINWVE